MHYNEGWRVSTNAPAPLSDGPGSQMQRVLHQLARAYQDVGGDATDSLHHHSAVLLGYRHRSTPARRVGRTMERGQNKGRNVSYSTALPIFSVRFNGHIRQNVTRCVVSITVAPYGR